VGNTQGMSINHLLSINFLVKPEFLQKPRDVTIVLQGSDVVLPCNVTGIPKPCVKWRFNGGDLPPSKQKDDGPLKVYAVKNNQSYEGLYTCEASSIAGKLASNVTLIVDGKLFSSFEYTPFILFLNQGLSSFQSQKDASPCKSLVKCSIFVLQVLHFLV